MTTGQTTDNHLKQLSLGLSDAHVSAVVKCPKVVVLGVAELGLKASLSLHDPEGEEKPISKRLSGSVTVKVSSVARDCARVYRIRVAFRRSYGSG